MPGTSTTVLGRRAFLATCAAAVANGLRPPASAHAEAARVTAESLRLRSYPWGQVIGSLPGGASVRVNARAWDEDGVLWYYVTTGAGSVGWVHGSYVAPDRDAWARVGIQAGHWRYQEADYPLNVQPGTVTPDYTEVEVNLAIALVLSRRLAARGIAVDLLPTAVPTGYRADAVVAIHSDAGASYVRGFFVDRPFRSPVAAAEAALARLIIASYARWTGIPYVQRSTDASRDYYAYRLVDPLTPIVLIETGCLTNAADRAIIAGRPGLVADALAGPIAAFLS